jgi:hypothetical protein
MYQEYIKEEENGLNSEWDLNPWTIVCACYFTAECGPRSGSSR